MVDFIKGNLPEKNQKQLEDIVIQKLCKERPIWQIGHDKYGVSDSKNSSELRRQNTEAVNEDLKGIRSYLVKILSEGRVETVKACLEVVYYGQYKL